jgi:parallel beta-helix repeat protein
MRKNLIALLVLLVLFPGLVGATTYYVSTSGNDANAGTQASPWRTIQKAANTMVAGDTCFVNPGTYDERVSPANSGSSGSLITFRANGNATVAGFYLSSRSYIRIDGFRLTYLSSNSEAAIFLASSHGSEIINNVIFRNAGIGIFLHPVSPSNDVTISGNTISYPGGVLGNAIGDAGIISNGDHVIIEGNDISHVADFTNIWGRNVVVRNNLFHDCYMNDFPEYFNLAGHDPTGHHIDAVQYFSDSYHPTPLHFLLFENNTVRDALMVNVHGGIFRNMLANPGDSDVIYRFNTFYRLGSFMLQINPFNQLRAVHNTVIQTSSTTSTLDYRATYTVEVDTTSTDIKLVNNLFYNATRQVSNAHPYVVDSPVQRFFGDYNLLSPIGSFLPSETNGLVIANPLFNNLASGNDFSLQENSPAVDSGGPLTRVAAADSGSGISLIVEDARFFQDGWGMEDRGVHADWIAVGSATNVVEIASINYDTNTITLANSIIRNDGDAVYLYSDSNGRRVLYGDAPDIGAYEYESSSPPDEPVPGDINGDGIVNSADFFIVVSDFGKTSGFNNAKSDTNTDNIIDIYDVVYVASRITS